ncbi:hypothetical protein TNCV_4029211 [Trichonephila clavipes]|nr:hypothetical protein TNCV_4029211 [Trichonephila clavipes]
MDSARLMYCPALHKTFLAERYWACGLLEQLRLLHTCFHGCDEVIDRLWGILFHSSRSAISKSRTVAGGLGRAAMRHPNMSQTCSIGFRSGEHAGHSIRCIVSASSMFSTRRALCGRALSSWKTKESPMAPACVAFSVLFQRAVNCIYRSSVDVVARGRPTPGRRLTFPVSWNRFHSLATTLLATPTASATLRCVFPDYSLPITRHAMDSSKSRF